jgi:predicted HTH transcriptional regulator
MIPRQLNEIKVTDLEALEINSVRESRTLDFKETLPGSTDDEKKDFLADIVSFANTGGGDIAFGFKEIKEAGKSTGTAEVVGLQGSINQDAEKLRFHNMIRDGIRPRITGVQIHFVEGHNKGLLAIIRIPQSWAAPHMVT